MNWKVIAENPKYEVCDLGLVRRVGVGAGSQHQHRRVGKMDFLTPWIHRSGHAYVGLWLTNPKRSMKRQVHQLVIRAFGPEQPPNTECRHKDGNSKNNRLDNLEWGTRAQNIQDYRRHNGKHHRAKLTLAQATEIRSKIRGPKCFKGEYVLLGKEYGVDPDIIGKIVRNQNYLCSP